MKKLVLILAAVCASCTPSTPVDKSPEVVAWERRAQNVTIIRDDWGIPHVYGATDADAVFGVMHTSSGVDNIDEYLETVVKKDDGAYYRYGAEERPLKATTTSVPYKTATGMATKAFTVYRSHHGPIVRETDGKWVSVRLMHEPVKALTQSYSRTKARSLKAFRETMELHTNSSNNTVYADADGAIAYFHSNFIPKRDTAFDWTRPVDGSDPGTEWNGLLSIDDSPNVFNPATGWLYNTNNWKATSSGSTIRQLTRTGPVRWSTAATPNRGMLEVPAFLSSAAHQALALTKALL